MERVILLASQFQLSAASSADRGGQTFRSHSRLGLAGLRHTDAMQAAAAEAQQLVGESRRQSGAGALAEALHSAKEAADLLRPAVRRAGYSWAGTSAGGGGGDGDGFGHAVGLLWVEAMVEVGAAARTTERHGLAVKVMMTLTTLIALITVMRC